MSSKTPTERSPYFILETPESERLPDFGIEPAPEEEADIPVHIAYVTRLWGLLEGLTKKCGYAQWRMGHALIRLRDKVPHGEWQSTVDQHFPFTTRTATNYMNMAVSVTEEQAREHGVTELYELAGVIPNPGEKRRALIMRILNKPDSFLEKANDFTIKARSALPAIYSRLPASIHHIKDSREHIRVALTDASETVSLLVKTANDTQKAIAEMLAAIGEHDSTYSLEQKDQ